jgi:hypothetical protein
MVEAATWVAVLIGVVALFAGIARRNRSRVGSAAAGTVYDLLQEDKRKALEIIVEERAGARDPERAQGNKPDLENPAGR